MPETDAPPGADDPSAKVLSLAQADQPAGGVTDHVDIDPKLQLILAGQDRQVIDRIQQETGTSIYMPTQLTGVLGNPAQASTQLTGYHQLALPKPQPQLQIQPQAHHQAHLPLQPQFRNHLDHNGHHGPPMHQPFLGNGFGQHIGNGPVMSPQMTGSTIVSNGPVGPWPMNQHQPRGPSDRPVPFDPPPLHHPTHLNFPQDLPNRPVFSHLPPSPGYPPPPYHQPNLTQSPQRPMDMPRWQGHDPALPPHHSHHAPHHPHDAPSHHHAMRAPSVPSLGPHGPMNGFQQSQFHGQPLRGPATPTHHPQGPYPPRPTHVLPHRPPFQGRQGHPHHLGPQPPFNPYGYPSGPMSNGASGGAFGQRPPTTPAPRKPKVSEFAIEKPAIDRFAGRHPGLGTTGGEQGPQEAAWRIWISGTVEGVQRAKQMLLDAAAAKEFNVISRDLHMNQRRLDWVLRGQLDAVRKIMVENATYIQVPVIGSQSGVITVFGDHFTRIERSLRKFAKLASQMYECMVWIVADGTEPPSLRPGSDGVEQAAALQETGAIVNYNAQCFDIHGTVSQVKSACERLLASLSLQHTKVCFRYELSKEYQTFYGGTGNGKMNKIKNAHHVDIEFKAAGDYNFLVEISGSGQQTIDALNAALSELPAQSSFHIPETYHKRIIGDRGSNIQVIMGKFQCFIKCCSADEHAAIGGYDEIEDNILVYLPAKNTGNLVLAKEALMQVLDIQDRNYTKQPVRIERQYHQMLSCDKGVQGHASRTRTVVRFPFRETNSDEIMVHGPEAGIDDMTRMLLGLLPTHAKIHMPTVPIDKVVHSPEFDCFRHQIKARHHVDIALGHHFGPGPQASFILRGGLDPVQLALEALHECLKGHEYVTHVGSPRATTNEFEPDILHLIPAPAPYGPAGNHTARHSIHFAGRAPDQDLKALFQTEGSAALSNGSSNALGFASPLDTPNSERLSGNWQRTQPPPSSSSQNGSVGSRRNGPSKRDSDPVVLNRLKAGVLARLPRGSASRAQSLDVSHTTPKRLWGPQEPDLPLNLDAAFGSSSIGPLQPHSTGEAKSDVDGITRGLYGSRI